MLIDKEAANFLQKHRKAMESGIAIMHTFANGDAISTVYPPRSYRPAIRIWTLLATEYFPPVRLLARRRARAPSTRSSVPNAKDKMRRQIIPDVLGGCSCAVSTIRCRSVKFLNNFR